MANNLTTIKQSRLLAARYIRRLLRQPLAILLTLAQPVMWLVLYGQLFKRIVDLPGFHADSYITFLMPGIVIMGAVLSAGWSGMGIVDDLNHGFIDRLLVAPVSRTALMIGRMIYTAFIAISQSAVLICFGMLLGARVPGGLLGVFVLLLAALLISAAVGGISNGLAFLARKQDLVIASVNLVIFPLTFVSSAFIAKTLIPKWLEGVIWLNPFEWAIEAGRAALGASVEWHSVLLQLFLLSVFLLAAATWGTWAYGVYQARR
jgi:ABC-2 type transport system permease protein